MSGLKFTGVVVGVLLATALLVWIFVSLAAVAFALTQGDTGAVLLCVICAVAGIAVAALAWVIGSRVAKTRAARQ